MHLARAKKGGDRTSEEHTLIVRALKHEKAQAHAKLPEAFVIPIGIAKELSSMMATWLLNEAACPPAVRQESDRTLNLLDVDFWLWYRKVTPKGMSHAFKNSFWEVFNTPGMYDILTESQYKVSNSSDGSMRLRMQTACPEWKEGADEDAKILIWLSVHAGLTSECATEVIEPFARRRFENQIHGTTWNDAAKWTAARQPYHTKRVAASTSTLTNDNKAPLIDLTTSTQSLNDDDNMIVDDAVKTVAESRRHENDTNPDLQDIEHIIDGDLIF